MELQALFKAIRCDWSQVYLFSYLFDCKPYWNLFMDLLQKMVLPKEGPDVFFDFTGKSSGVTYCMNLYI